MNIDETKPDRQNRTITLHLGNTLAEYEPTYLSETGMAALIRRVEIADSLEWGCLPPYTRRTAPINYTSLITIAIGAVPNTLTAANRG